MYRAFRHFFYTLFPPESLRKLLDDQLQRQRKLFTEETRSWSARFWQQFSKELPNNTTVPDVSGLMTHLKCEVMFDGEPFACYGSPDGHSAFTSPTAGSLAIAPAKMLDIVKSVTLKVETAIGQEKAASAAAQVASAAAQLFRNEQAVGASRAATASTALDGLKSKWGAGYQEVNKWSQGAEQALANLQKSSQLISQKLPTVQQLAAQGQRIGDDLTLKLEQRRVLAETIATAGRARNPDEQRKLAGLDLQHVNGMADIRRLVKQGQDLENEIAILRAQFDSTSGVLQNRIASWQRGLKTTAAIAEAARQLRAPIESPAAVQAEWKRVKDQMTKASMNVQKLSAQLAALRPWHLTEAKDHPQKREFLGQVSDLIANIDGWRSAWEQRLAKLTPPKRP
jgi:chromosome segregation ATPase